MQETVIAHLMKPFWQNVLQKAAQELHCRKYHGLPLPGGGILLTEGYVVVVQSNYAVVGDGNPVDISPQVTQHLLCLLEGRAGEDYPALVPDLLGEVFFGQCLFGQLHEDGPEDRRERPDRHEELFAGRSPDAVFVKATGRNEEMKMGMIVLGAGPGMEHSHHPQLTADEFTIKSQLAQCPYSHQP